MNIILWIMQIVVGLMFLGHAFLMIRPSPQRLQSGMKYILEMPAGLRMFAGIAESLAGLALVLSPVLRAVAWLTPLAAAGLVLLMVGAIVFHLPRREYPNIGLNVFLGVLAAIVAWGRFGPYHF
jgi:uncharacterized membrane protein